MRLRRVSAETLSLKEFAIDSLIEVVVTEKVLSRKAPDALLGFNWYIRT